MLMISKLTGNNLKAGWVHRSGLWFLDKAKLISHLRSESRPLSGWMESASVGWIKWLIKDLIRGCWSIRTSEGEEPQQNCWSRHEVFWISATINNRLNLNLTFLRNSANPSSSLWKPDPVSSSIPFSNPNTGLNSGYRQSFTATKSLE